MKPSSWFTIAILFVVGILLVVFHSRIDILSWIIILVGAGLMIPGAWALISTLLDKERTQGRGPTIVASIVCVALGLWMICEPAFFATIIAYIFGALLIGIGLYHIILLAVWMRPLVMPFWFYIIPVLLIVAGIVLLATNINTLNSVVVLVMGISLICSAFNSALEFAASHPARVKES